jgi:hypothetical protein
VWKQAVAIAAVAGLGAAGCFGGGANRSRQSDPHALVLRAGDMPRGYREGDDTRCGLATSEEDDELASLFAKERSHACIIELERLWASAPGPPGVTSAAYVFGDESGAKRGFRARRLLVEYTADLSARSEEPASLGDEARLERGRGLNDPAAALIWRSGRVVAVLATEPADGRATLVLAKRQQRRIEGKARPPRLVDTVELALDDPDLKVPVYWLGRSYDPRGPLPVLRLGEAMVLASGPGDKMVLRYGGLAGRRSIGVSLDLWRPEAWGRFRRTLLGRLVWDSPCARRTSVRLRQGHAEIFEGYGTPRPLKPPCPERSPDRTLAHVYLSGVVVAVDMPTATCALPRRRATIPTRRSPA